ncbi:hypothetical protein GCM10009802_30550 [Streptomyces synnematoformans]|uniref:Uncharacterized protein n=1 Tax=Streptomyces synnematoformans TaxID=415721 RepID=A0ABP5K1K6_9ACTN
MNRFNPDIEGPFSAPAAARGLRRPAPPVTTASAVSVSRHTSTSPAQRPTRSANDSRAADNGDGERAGRRARGTGRDRAARQPAVAPRPAGKRATYRRCQGVSTARRW